VDGDGQGSTVGATCSTVFPDALAGINAPAPRTFRWCSTISHSRTLPLSGQLPDRCFLPQRRRGRSTGPVVSCNAVLVRDLFTGVPPFCGGERERQFSDGRYRLWLGRVRRELAEVDPSLW
jgi:hypothetical protein